MEQLTEPQIEFIKSSLGEFKSSTEIQADFRQRYEGRMISFDTIDSIKASFKDEIQVIKDKITKDTSHIPVTYSSVRLALVWKALEICCQSKGRGSYPVTDPLTGVTTYKEKVDIDHVNIQKYLDIAMREEFLAKKLILEKLSRGIKDKVPELERTGIPVVPIYSGYDDEEV